MRTAQLPSGAAEVVVGIDPSATGTAFCALDATNGALVLEKLVRTKHKGALRLQEISDGVNGFFAALVAINSEPVHICLENYSMAAKYGRELAGEVGGSIKQMLLYCVSGDKVRFPTLVSPQGLKKFVLGKGTGQKKNLILKGVYMKWGADYSDDNLADAYALARIALAVCSESFVQYVYEREVLDQLTEHTEWEPQPSQTSSLRTATKAPSSGSSPHPIRRQSPPLSPTLSTTTARSSSGPSGRVRLIRRSKPVP